jgi:hypothetical protein
MLHRPRKTFRPSRTPLLLVVCLALSLVLLSRRLPMDRSLLEDEDAVPLPVAVLGRRVAAEKRLVPFLLPCPDCPPAARVVEPLADTDAIFVVDHLNNWHWCPSALARQRSLDSALYEFLDAARARSALIVHAVSDSKNHYLLADDVRPFVRRDTDPGTLAIPTPLARSWDWITKAKLSELGPLPPPVSLSIDKVCGNAGAALFGDKNRKPAWMPGLNASRLGKGDVVATEQNAIYTALVQHRPRVRRILFVGVHLHLCLLYSRWFSLLRVAKAWGLDRVRMGVVVSLTDVGNSDPEQDPSSQTAIDVGLVRKTACWIRCQVAPAVLGGHVDDIVRLYDFV